MQEFSLQELAHAQKYPFSGTAKAIVQHSKLTLDNIPESVLLVARKMVVAAYTDNKFFPRISSYKELLLDNVLAFPVSKIIVSLIARHELYRKFSLVIYGNTFQNLEQEKDDVLVDMANEFGVKFNLSEKPFFAELAVQDYLKPDLEEPFMKLVNRNVGRGVVYLGRNDFSRFIALLAAQQTRDSLPVFVKDVPNSLKGISESIEKEFSEAVRRKFSKSDFGEVAPESFPPCMEKIYSELSCGINVNHSARFAIATFLASVGMSGESVVDLFRLAPNFNERTTRYQVNRLVGENEKGYSSPSCDKMKSYNLCVSNCRVSHPVQFYSREIFKNKKQDGGEESEEKKSSE